jgi:hypothetical protein
MVSAVQIEEVIASYIVSGDLRKFVLDFSRVSFNIHKSGTPEAIRLANCVDARIAELNVGHASEDMFQRWMADLDRASPKSSNSFISGTFMFPHPVNLPVEESAFPALAESAHTSPGVEFGLAVLLQA